MIISQRSGLHGWILGTRTAATWAIRMKNPQGFGESGWKCREVGSGAVQLLQGQVPGIDVKAVGSGAGGMGLELAGAE
ncbi:hypothetical protein GCM10010466_33440 [Planomonospora alba]|uniref:Uncharacterized protein n=1 Tax=Planomonospora alba TaxID=161354 RepID=A0ABP6NAP7_9ACTN